MASDGLTLARKVVSTVRSISDGTLMPAAKAIEIMLAMTDALEKTRDAVSEARKPFEDNTLVDIALASTGVSAPEKAIFDGFATKLDAADKTLMDVVAATADGPQKANLPVSGAILKSNIDGPASLVVDTLTRIDSMRNSFGYEALSAIDGLIDSLSSTLTNILSLLSTAAGAVKTVTGILSSPITWVLGGLIGGGLLLKTFMGKKGVRR